jgi:hypothetical protein
MGDLLERVIRAHGGAERWGKVSRFQVQTSIGGAIWALKGKPGLLTDVTIEGETRAQRLTITPFPRPGQSATWAPDRQAIEAAGGTLVEERTDPAAPFAGQTRESPWDDLQVAYFASEANWNYFVAPFILAEPGFGTEETGPWEENGQVWQRLLVTYPDSIVAHTRQQTYYFDDTGLLRRLDYAVDILGGGPAVHYPSEYRRFDGIMVPTRRRVYVRRPDGSPVLESTSIAIDVARVSFE